MAKRIYTTDLIPELTVVNNETGEIVSGVSKTTYTDPEAFMMCFLNSISEISQLDGNTIRILMYCWKYSTFNSCTAEANIICNNKLFKDNIRNDGFDIKDSSIDKAIHILNSKGMLIRKCRGTYMLNPKYFFKGTLTNRSKIIRTITYNPIG